MAHVHGLNGYIGVSLPYKTNQDKANAEFIVRACNAHDELVEALTKLHDYILSQRVHKGCDAGEEQRLQARTALRNAGLLPEPEGQGGLRAWKY
jgi:hypothetical protein